MASDAHRRLIIRFSSKEQRVQKLTLRTSAMLVGPHGKARRWERALDPPNLAYVQPLNLKRSVFASDEKMFAVPYYMVCGDEVRTQQTNISITAYLINSYLYSKPSPSTPSPSYSTAPPPPSVPKLDAQASSSSAPTPSQPQQSSRPPTSCSYSCSRS